MATTCAAPIADAPPAYGAPAPYAPHPVPFSYQYGVKDDYSGASFDKDETQDAYGVVAGKKYT